MRLKLTDMALVFKNLIVMLEESSEVEFENLL